MTSGIIRAIGKSPLSPVVVAQERGRARDLDATVAELLTELEGQWTKETT